MKTIKQKEKSYNSHTKQPTKHKQSIKHESIYQKSDEYIKTIHSIKKQNKHNFALNNNYGAFNNLSKFGKHSNLQSQMSRIIPPQQPEPYYNDHNSYKQNQKKSKQSQKQQLNPKVSRQLSQLTQGVYNTSLNQRMISNYKNKCYVNSQFNNKKTRKNLNHIDRQLSDKYNKYQKYNQYNKYNSIPLNDNYFRQQSRSTSKRYKYQQLRKSQSSHNFNSRLSLCQAWIDFSLSKNDLLHDQIQLMKMTNCILHHKKHKIKKPFQKQLNQQYYTSKIPTRFVKQSKQRHILQKHDFHKSLNGKKSRSQQLIYFNQISEDNKSPKNNNENSSYKHNHQKICSSKHNYQKICSQKHNHKNSSSKSKKVQTHQLKNHKENKNQKEKINQLDLKFSFKANDQNNSPFYQFNNLKQKSQSSKQTSTIQPSNYYKTREFDQKNALQTNSSNTKYHKSNQIFSKINPIQEQEDNLLDQFKQYKLAAQLAEKNNKKELDIKIEHLSPSSVLEVNNTTKKSPSRQKLNFRPFKVIQISKYSSQSSQNQIKQFISQPSGQQQPDQTSISSQLTQNESETQLIKQFNLLVLKSEYQLQQRSNNQASHNGSNSYVDPNKSNSQANHNQSRSSIKQSLKDQIYATSKKIRQISQKKQEKQRFNKIKQNSKTSYIIN